MDRKLKIVVADDMKVLAERMKSIVEKNPRVEKVEMAFDGEDAVIQIMNLEPDIVFTDMQMPKRTGIEVIDTIKYYPAVKRKPKYVLVTSDRSPELILKARELEFDIEYKPISPEKVNEYIDTFEFIELDTEEEDKKMKEEVEEVRKELRKQGFLTRIKNKLKK